MNIRPAKLGDAEQIAFVHVESWRSAYEGILPDVYLDSLSVGKRKQSWLWTFEHLNENQEIYVAENEQGRIVGFSDGGKNRNPEFPHEGELYAIYLLKEYHRQGIGKRLFAAVTESLRRNGYGSFMLWVLQDNPTLGFYEFLGGRVVGRKAITIGGNDLIELAVGWEVKDV